MRILLDSGRSLWRLASLASALRGVACGSGCVCLCVCVCVCVCPLTACLCSYTISIKRFINLSIKALSPPLVVCPPITHMYVCSCTFCHPGATWHCPVSPYTNMGPVASLRTPKHSRLTWKSPMLSMCDMCVCRTLSYSLSGLAQSHATSHPL